MYSPFTFYPLTFQFSLLSFKCVCPSSTTPSSTRPSASRRATSSSTRMASRTRSSPAAGPARTSCRSRARRRRANSSSSKRSGRRTASRRTRSSIESASALARGGRRVCRRYGRDIAPACLLDERRARQEAVLLSDRSRRNGDLHHRGRAQVRRQLDRERSANGKRLVEPRPPATCTEDGDRILASGTFFRRTCWSALRRRES